MQSKPSGVQLPSHVSPSASHVPGWPFTEQSVPGGQASPELPPLEELPEPPLLEELLLVPG